MPETRISELVKRLNQLQLQSDTINVERRCIIARIERTNNREDTRPATTRPATQRGGPSFSRGDRVYVCNLTKGPRGRKVTNPDRYASVRYIQRTATPGEDQVYITTDSGIKTYRLSKNLRRVDTVYCDYEESRR